MYNQSWPDSYEEKRYKILEPSEALHNTSDFLRSKGFIELHRTMLRAGYTSFEERDNLRDYNPQDDDKLCVTVTESGIVILGYDPKFIRQNEQAFDMHWNPQHLQIGLAGSSRAIDEVVTKLFADVKLIGVK